MQIFLDRKIIIVVVTFWKRQRPRLPLGTPSVRLSVYLSFLHFEQRKRQRAVDAKCTLKTERQSSQKGNTKCIIMVS